VLTLAGSEVALKTYADARTGVVVMLGLASQASDPPMQGVQTRISSSSSARPPRSDIPFFSSSSANALPLSMVTTSSSSANQLAEKISNIVLTLAGSEVDTNTYADGRTGVVVMPRLASQASDPPMQGEQMRTSSSSSARPPRSDIQRPSSSANTLPLSMVTTSSSSGSNSQMVTTNSYRNNQPVFKLLKGKEYYKELVEIMGRKIRSFSIYTNAGIANTSEAPRKASNGMRIYVGPRLDGELGLAGGPEVVQYNGGNIMAGAGYSGDSQQIGPQICYNATVSSTSGQQAYVQMNTAISFSDLESQLKISVDISGKFPMFSAEAGASYLRSVQDKDYSLSLNYYEYATNNVGVQLAGYGEAALTEVGKGFYNGGKNPYFGLLCGDNYITSYQQVALLAMGINIKFSSSVAKQEFEEKAGATFGSIISAAESVKNVVMMQAFQVGGDPSQLSKILNKDSSGKYYALTCSLTAMEDCVKAAGGLLDYAKESFSTQFSFQNNTGLTPLGIAFSQYASIKYIGLVAPPSLVTQEVIQDRDSLFTTLK
ncbi:uncharacterized protein LOC108665956, partial [Hyalella azteca]|uniref:Uncharacterized protein LOC108665956 n=1 Tax=Hyalella azteca TaxID=294128 RepID=A0A8B7N339_HYAAZ